MNAYELLVKSAESDGGYRVDVSKYMIPGGYMRSACDLRRDNPVNWIYAFCNSGFMYQVATYDQYVNEDHAAGIILMMMINDGFMGIRDAIEEAPSALDIDLEQVGTDEFCVNVYLGDEPLCIMIGDNIYSTFWELRLQAYGLELDSPYPIYGDIFTALRNLVTVNMLVTDVQGLPSFSDLKES